jgi:hypothetical protein
MHAIGTIVVLIGCGLFIRMTFDLIMLVVRRNWLGLGMILGIMAICGIICSPIILDFWISLK